jgi:hypothetical protein
MNKQRLSLLLNNYIKNFSLIEKEHRETYKWVAIQHFQDNFDVDAENFAEMLRVSTAKSENLIDATTQPLYGMIFYAEQEPETVRNMFKALYAEDDGDLIVRQKKIDKFIQDSEILRNKYAKDSWRYQQNQRSVMSYLVFMFPEVNYMYKYSQAMEFADCVDFFGDWGNGSNFKLNVYYKMCDELVNVIKENKELMEKNKERYKNASLPLYKDESLHILAFDIIYCSQRYGLYNGIEYQHTSSAEKKEKIKEIEKALIVQEEFEKAEENYKQLLKIKDFILPQFKKLSSVEHKTFGKGLILSVGENGVASISFGETTKSFSLSIAIGVGSMKVGNEKLEKYIKENFQIFKSETNIISTYQRLCKEMEKYIHILQ